MVIVLRKSQAERLGISDRAPDEQAAPGFGAPPVAPSSPMVPQGPIQPLLPGIEAQKAATATLRPGKLLPDKVRDQLPASPKYNAKGAVSNNVHMLETPYGPMPSRIQKGRASWIRVSDLLDTPIRPIEGAEDVARFLSLVQAFKDGKKLEPIRLAVDKKGRRFVDDGNHRLVLARAMGIDYVPVEFVPASDLEFDPSQRDGTLGQWAGLWEQVEVKP